MDVLQAKLIQQFSHAGWREPVANWNTVNSLHLANWQVSPIAFERVGKWGARLWREVAVAPTMRKCGGCPKGELLSCLDRQGIRGMAARSARDKRVVPFSMNFQF